MANSLSAKKRIRQNERAQMRNKSAKSEIKTLTKKLLLHIEAKDKEAAEEAFRKVVARMDKAGRKRIYHPRTIARKKSTIAKLLGTLS